MENRKIGRLIVNGVIFLISLFTIASYLVRLKVLHTEFDINVFILIAFIVGLILVKYVTK